MSEATDPAERSRHVDQPLPCRWHAVEYGGQKFIVRDVPEGTAKLYAVEGHSRNVRTLAQAEAVLYDGQVTRPYHAEDSGLVYFTEDWAGDVGRHALDEMLDEPAIVLAGVASGSGKPLVEDDDGDGDYDADS